ncbi:MAG: hypothetical protein IPN14_11835 [Bacteroidetes bacterium]|nr:hypothetical protein [Bacteroidota bacterium]
MKSIIHFTSEFETLKTIICSSSLRLFYCKEDFYLGNKKASSAVHPMVSFSECIVKTIDKKKITYGKFGIGFKKAWTVKNKLHPVLYVDNNSLIANSLADLLVARRKNATTQLAPNIRLAIMTIKCFTKNANGYNSYFNVDDFDFKSENEWRYVPTKKQIDGNLISQTKSKYLENPDYYNNKLKEYSLKFSLEDIEYLFVSTEQQRQTILKLISIDKDKIKISKWTTQR